MKSSLYEMLSIISFALAGVLFAAAAAAFIKFKIPSVVGYLTGATARKKIKEMQSEKYNGQQADSKEKRGNTDKLSTDKLKNKKSASNPAINSQEDLSGSEKTDVLTQTDSTTVLEGSEETTVLSGNVNTVLYDNPIQNTPEESGTTQTLSQKNMPRQPFEVEYKGEINAFVEQSIVILHTDEKIA